MRSTGRDRHRNRHNGAHEGEEGAARPRSPRDLHWMLAIALASGVVLWRAWNVVRPLDTTAARGIAQTTGCLTNLEQIGRGFALYASDWDGRFPRGKDAEDQAHPQIWRSAEYNQATFYKAVVAAPLLPTLLQDYGVPSAAWHCPADVGWTQMSGSSAGPQSLQSARPSAWQQYGMSYSYLTLYGLRGLRARDLKGGAPSAALLFDDESWHRDGQGGQRRAGTLFADGSAQMVASAQLNILVNQASPLDVP